MVEGDKVFKEAIDFLKNLSHLLPLEWDENLFKSAKAHVDDIGPKGLVLYQSSDGTEPEDRIGKYGHYIETLGENIDFGPNDAIGVIVSLTLDDGEEERPHKKNLFSIDYKKVGIACGPHSTEFDMCVMDFAFDFIPLNNENNYEQLNNNKSINEENEKKIKDLEDQINELNKKLVEDKKKIEKILLEKKQIIQKNKEISEKLKKIEIKNKENENISIKLKSQISQKEEDIINYKKQIENLQSSQKINEKKLKNIEQISS